MRWWHGLRADKDARSARYMFRRYTLRHVQLGVLQSGDAICSSLGTRAYVDYRRSTYDEAVGANNLGMPNHEGRIWKPSHDCQAGRSLAEVLLSRSETPRIDEMSCCACKEEQYYA